MTDKRLKENFFYLFRHHRIEPKLNRYAVLLSLGGVIGWLYFSFIEKSFVGKMISGDALIVDLVLGLPLVLMFTIIVYACVYWSCKLLIIFLLPQALIPYQLEDPKQDAETERQEEAHGKNYWDKSDSGSTDDPIKTKHGDPHDSK
ncbi:MAG: hypothetical protein L3J00_00830 [Thiomicrorhabdus sp.]|nr:hypothetical protein [Thiomicrorhabdus sp.]